MKKIAILMCVYKGDSYFHFEESMRSIVENCGLVDFRVYLHIDGELSEEHYNVINSFNFHTIVKSDVSVGLAKGLNKLICKLEDEDYYFRMDADDISMQGRFTEQIDYMESNKSIDVSGGSIIEFQGDISNNVYHRAYPQKDRDIKEVMYKACPLAHVTTCFRSGFFNKFGDYPVNYPYNEDIALWVKSAKKGCIFGNVERPLVYVRMDGAYSRRSVKKAIPEFKIYVSYALFRKRIPFWAFARLIFRYMPLSTVQFFYNSKVRKFLVK